MIRRCGMSLAHHSLVAWQRADDLFIRLHQLSLKAFPAYERLERRISRTERHNNAGSERRHSISMRVASRRHHATGDPEVRKKIRRAQAVVVGPVYER